MKIAVYTIALNEAQFVERWAKSAIEADYRVVADTGSIDSTVEKLRAAGIDVHNIDITPWRFDHARNANLALLPVDADICLSLDMDEVLVPGWRQALLAAWLPGTTRLRYTYVWNWDKNGNPKTHFFGEKIHQRNGYTWRHPVHETLYPLAGVVEKVAWCSDLQIHHHADDTKSRRQYLSLLELATKEDPASDRCAHYFGRELMFRHEYDAAIRELQRHLSLSNATWKAERAASWRFIAYCHKKMDRLSEARSALLQSCAEAPLARETWYELAKFCLEQKDWAGGVSAARRALDITEMPRGHARDATAWGIGPYDIGSICAYYNREPELARSWLVKALEMEPDNPRLIKNGSWILSEKS